MKNFTRHIQTKERLYVLLHALFFFSSCGVSSNIHTVDTLDLLEAEVKTFGKDDLVVFDVDRVLVIEKSAILQNSKLFETLIESRLKKLPDQKRHALGSLFRYEGKRMLVDEKTPTLIKKIQNKGVTVIALTALNSGSLGVIKKLEDWRIEDLKSLGFDFSLAFKLSEPLLLNPKRPLAVNKSLRPCIAKEGILFSGRYAKGDVLECFLTAIGWKPKRIIFVDDDKYRVESVACACKVMGIPFMGLHYIKADKVQKPVDIKVAQFQADYLIEHEEWLDDEKARALMPVEDSQFFMQPG